MTGDTQPNKERFVVKKYAEHTEQSFRVRTFVCKEKYLKCLHGTSVLKLSDWLN